MKGFWTLFVLLALTASSLFSQEEGMYEAFLDGQFNEVKKKKQASYIRELAPLSDTIFQARIYTIEGKLKIKGAYVVQQGVFIEHGDFEYYHTNGKVESSGEYVMGYKIGAWKRFSSSGMQRPDRYYDPKGAGLIRDAVEGKIESPVMVATPTEG